MVACRKDEDEAVRDQSVRMLSGWPDPVVLPELLAIAESTDGVRHQVLAIRGLVRLAGPQKDKPADVKMLTRAMELAKRPHEKRLVLGVLGGVATPASLAVVVPALDDSALVNEAGLAVVSIAEKMKEGSKDELRTAVRKVLKTTKNQQVRRRAEQVLKSL